MGHTLADVINELAHGGLLVSAADAERKVPTGPGLYAIFVDDATSLPSPFGNRLARNGTQLIYVGKASTSLLERPVSQDLRHRRASTFFRGIGAVLGYVPLAGEGNQNNYRFSAADTAEITSWINRHLSVRWVELHSNLIEEFEPDCIRQLRPLLNTTYNPDAMQALKDLREKCRCVARNQKSVGCVFALLFRFGI